MKIKRLLMMLMAVVTLAGCDEHEAVVDLSLKVGNVYRMDGSIVPPLHHKKQLNEAPQAVGVVVAVGGPEDNYSALIMGLEDLDDKYWYSAKSAETSASSDLYAFNGKENTTKLLTEYTEDAELDPLGAVMAATYTAGGITGWHLPSVGEMKAVVKNRLVIRETLHGLGADEFRDEWYLSSTVDGSSDETAVMYNYCIIMPEGRVVSELKTLPHRVRPFMIIR